MKLLVLAQTPPPLHGQSLMVQTLVEGLAAAAPQITIHHVNPRLSRDAADIGRWRIGKLGSLLAACTGALLARLQHGSMTLYYVPAPGKRSALYRDFVVMLLCRPFFNSLVLHWHAVGLGEWLTAHAILPERWLARLLLGRADLAIVLAPELAADAQELTPRRIAVVPNGTDIAHRERSPAPTADRPCEVLFLGLCTREKGVFDTLAGVAFANQREPGRFHLTFAGAFASRADEKLFQSQAVALGYGIVSHVGFADESRKQALFAAVDVFCFPTVYPHEGQPLVLIEALAYDVPIITTRWRAIPSLLPAEHVWFVEPHRPDQIADALHAALQTPRPAGTLREYYLAHYTRERHLANLAAALAC